MATYIITTVLMIWIRSPAILKLEEGSSDGNLLQFYVTLPEADKYLLLYVFLKLGESP